MLAFTLWKVSLKGKAFTLIEVPLIAVAAVIIVIVMEEVVVVIMAAAAVMAPRKELRIEP